MSKLRGGLIQMGLKASTDKSPAEIRKAMLDAHIPLIEEAGKRAGSRPTSSPDSCSAAACSTKSASLARES